jgi:hypothetical protein
MSTQPASEHFILIRQLARDRVFKNQSSYIFEESPTLSIFHIDIDAAWGTYTRYTLFRDSAHMNDSTALHVVVKRYWDKSHDYRLIYDESERSEQPSIVELAASLDATSFAPLWEEGKNLTIPVVDQMHLRGFDGADYVAHFGAGFSSATSTFRFWSDVPDEWQPFKTWLDALIKYFDERLG